MLDSRDEEILQNITSILIRNKRLTIELEEKDEAIFALQKKVEVLQSGSREFTDSKRLIEKENRELLSSNRFLKQKLSAEQVENDRLKREVLHLRQDLSSQEEKIRHLEDEHEKAKHIIKNLLKKYQCKPPVALPRTI